MKTLTVTTDDEGIRLDRYFKRHFSDFKISELNRCLREKNIKLNGKRAEGGSRLTSGDIILCPDTFGQTSKEEKNAAKDLLLTEKQQEEIRSWIIYKSQDIIAINKPSGIAVQGGSKQTKHIDNMLSALSLGLRRPKLVHRLDKDTSGVLILARNDLAATWLTRAFKERTIHKTYYAILEKRIKKGKGIIKAPLRKSLIGNQEMVIVDKENGQEAVTEFEVLSSSPSATLIKFHPLTGRTHQLRVHSLYIGHPIIGDKKYGNKNKEKLLLHAAEIDIPYNEQIIKILAPLPSYMKKAAQDFGLDIGDIL